MVCNACTNCLWQAIQCLLLLHSFCLEFQTQVWQHLFLYVMWQMVSRCKFWSCSHCVPLQQKNMFLSVSSTCFLPFFLSDFSNLLVILFMKQFLQQNNYHIRHTYLCSSKLLHKYYINIISLFSFSKNCKSEEDMHQQTHVYVTKVCGWDTCIH